MISGYSLTAYDYGLARRLRSLQEAVDFRDRVLASSPDERAAVRNDHHENVDRAVAELVSYLPNDLEKAMKDVF